MDKQSGHLSDVQVEQYGNAVTLERPEADDRDHQIETHLADCGACLERVLAAQRKRFILSANPNMNAGHNPHHPNPGAPGPDCPDEDDLRRLAAGLCSEDIGIKLTRHASQCDHCGPMLRAFIEDFSDELSDEDQAMLARLTTSSAGGQKKLVDRMLAASGEGVVNLSKKPFLWRWVLVPAALAVCGVIAFAVWYQQRPTPEKAEKLLAQAYAGHRTIDARFPDAAWGPMRVTQGPESESFRSLLEAEAIVSQRPAKDPENVEWLRASAEAEMLRWHPNRAIEILTPVIQKSPDSRLLTLDLAIAYLQRAEQSNGRQDYEQSVSLLSHVLKSNPADRVALFNRALAYEQLNEIAQAIADWKHLIAVGDDVGWAAEAHERLKQLENQ